jgi:hypothetical protein
VRAVALVLAALALTACESSQEKSANIERIVTPEREAAARRREAAQRSLTITHPSTVVKVLSTSVLHSSEGAAAVVILRNTSSAALRDLPIEITVKDKAGASVYTNATPGLAPALVTLPLLRAHATATWVDDQAQGTATPVSVSAEVGEGERDAEAIPSLAATGVHLSEGGAEGSLVNRSHTSQHEVVLYALARRGAAIVAAGSALVAQAEPGASVHFQAFLIGNAKGAQLEVSVGGAA